MNPLCLKMYGYDRSPSQQFNYNEVPLERYYDWMDDERKEALKKDQARLMKSMVLLGSTAAKEPLVFNDAHEVVEMQGRIFFPVTLAFNQIGEEAVTKSTPS